MFISFEGSEGSGKSTQIARLATWLKAQNYAVLQTREPGGSPFSEKVRHLLLHESSTLSAESELLLVVAARKEHYEQSIRPALAQGMIVLCDRYLDSTYAYQGGGRHLPEEAITQLHEWAFSGQSYLPDLTFFFNMPVSLGLERVKQRNQGKSDRIEAEGLEFFQRVHQAFEHRCTADPKRIITIDATQTVDAVFQALVQTLSSRVGGKVNESFS